MTDAQLIAAVVSDPSVVARHEGMSATALQRIAQTWLETEIKFLLRRPSIREDIREEEYELDLSTGTSVDQGVWFALPFRVVTITGFTIGSSRRPVKIYNHWNDFNQWWYERVGQASTSEETTVVAPYGKTGWQYKIILSPGTGGDDTAYILYLKGISDPVSLTDLPPDIHHVAMLGTANRMAGGAYNDQYWAALTDVLGELDITKDEASPMPRSRDQRMFNWNRSMEVAAPGSDSGAEWPARLLEG